MAFTDIVKSGGVMNFDRANVSSLVDIVSKKATILFPKITPGGGGGGEHSYVFF